eukprot:scaffold13122_cov56-Isochrysis_galbana.AAC.1
MHSPLFSPTSAPPPNKKTPPPPRRSPAARAKRLFRSAKKSAWRPFWPAKSAGSPRACGGCGTWHRSPAHPSCSAAVRSLPPQSSLC